MAALQRKGAGFLGFERVEADGKTPWGLGVRGNGDLTLTPEALTFRRWIPENEFVIPTRAIRVVSVGRGHNGKWLLFKIVLKVEFVEGDDRKIAGFTVGWKGAVERWKSELERAARDASAKA